MGALTAAIRTCSLIACVSNDTISCGTPSQDNTPLTFKNIAITGTFHFNDYIFDQPAMLQTNLKPVDNYLYCAESQDSDTVKITVSTSVEQKSILSFGFYGRIHNFDGMPVRTYTVTDVSGEICASKVIIPLVAVVIMLVALLIGFIVYKKSKKYNVIEL